MSYLNDKKIDDNEVIKTTNSPQLLRLEKMIEAEANVVNELYYQIGKKYYQKFSDTNDPDFVNMVSSIKSSHDKIENLLEQKRLIKGVVRCVKCGAELDNGAVFCISCGTKQDEFKKPEPVETVALFCEKCSAPLRKGSAFCSKCGTKIEAVKHIEKKADVPVCAPVVQAQPKVEKKAVVTEKEPAMKKRVCYVCNSEMGDNIFCTKCGAKYKDETMNMAQQPQQVTKEKPQPSPKVNESETKKEVKVETPDQKTEYLPHTNTPPVVHKPTPIPEIDENVTVAIEEEDLNFMSQKPQTPPAQNKRICKKCGADLGGNIFCTRCGTKYEQEKNVAAPKMPQTPLVQYKRICKKCGADLGSNVFCTRCGTKYEASNNTPASNRPQINGSKSMIDGQPIAHAGAVASKKRYCPVCHGEVIGNTLYCTKCGAKL